MATVIITFRIMPDGVDVNLDDIKKKAIEKIKTFGGNVHKEEKEPVAFGLVALKLMFTLDESKGDTEKLEKDICAIKGVQSCEVIDVRRAVG